MFASVLRRFSFIGWFRYWLLDRNYTAFLHLSLVGICLAGTVVMALLSRNLNPAVPTTIIVTFLIVLLMGSVVVFLVIYRNLELTAIFVFMLSMLVHAGIGTGTGTSLTFTFLTLLLWAFVWLFRKTVVAKKFDLRPSFANRPALFFMVAVVIAFFWSGAFPEARASYLFDEKATVRLMTAIVLIISPVTYILFSNLIRTERTFKILVWWLISFGLVIGLMSIVGRGGIIPIFNAKGQFATWFVALALGQLFFNTSLPNYIRFALVVGIGAWAMITLGLGLSWLSGWLPMVISGGLLLVIFSRKLATVAMIGFLILAAFNTSFISARFSDEQSVSGNTRSIAWARALDVVGKHFLFGAGPAGYEYYFQAYGYYDNAVGTADLSHNNYIDIVAQTGVVGFTLWIVMWAAQGLMIWKLFRKRIDNPFLTALKYSLVACYPAILISMMLGDWVTPFPYTQTLAGIDYTIWSWMLSGMAIALYYFVPTPPRDYSVSSLQLL